MTRGSPMMRVHEEFKKRIEEIRQATGQTSSQITKKLLFFSLLILFLPVIHATVYPSNFSFEDFNVFTNEIDEQPSATDDVLAGGTDGFNGSHDRGWDTGLSAAFDANSSFATVGTKSSYWRINYSGSVTTNSLAPTPVNQSLWGLNPGETKVFCMDTTADLRGGQGADVAFQLFIYVDGNEPASNGDTDNASKKKFPTWTQNTLRSTRTDCFSLKNNESTQKRIEYKNVGTGAAGGSNNYNIIHFDNLKVIQGINIISLDNPTSIGLGNDFNATVQLVWDENSDNAGPDANVQLRFTSTVIGAITYPMQWNTTTERWTVNVPSTAFPTNGTYNFTIDANVYVSGVFFTDTMSGSVQVVIAENQYVTFTPISNVASYEYHSIDVTPENELEDIIFRLDSNRSSAIDVNLIIFNSLQDGNQYFIYTASEGQYQQGIWVFDDTLTFGSSNDPIQKIWDQNHYRYQFIDTLMSLERKYYKLAYRRPMIYNQRFDGNWFNNLPPTDADIDGLTASRFTVSEVANIFSYLIQALPKLITDMNLSYEIQFTGRVDNNSSATISVIDYDVNTNTNRTTANLALTNGFKTFGVPYQAGSTEHRVLIKSNETYPKVITIYDIRIIGRDYFSRPLQVTDEFGVPFTALLLNGSSVQYILENQKARLRTKVFDRDANINLINYQAYMDGNRDANLVLQETDILNNETENAVFDIDHIIGGVVDLTSNGPNRDLQYRVQIVDHNGNPVAIQSKTFKMLQWPYFPKDLEISLVLNDTEVGTSPNGRFLISANNPDNIQGVWLRIIDQNTNLANPNYTKIYYKDIDFNCNGTNCGFEFAINDWVFPAEKKYTVHMLILSAAESVTGAINSKLLYQVFLQVNKKELEAFRILEAFPKGCYQGDIYGVGACDQFFNLARNFVVYRTYEKIPVVLQIRSKTKENLKNNMRVTYTLVPCLDNTEACAVQGLGDNDFSPDAFFYDDINGNNYWFFNQSPLTVDDKNFYRLMGTVTDVKSQFEIPGRPVLTAKSEPELVYAPDTNVIGDEYLLKIDDTNLIRSPRFIFFGCIKYDTNLVISSVATMDITCISLFSHGNTPLSRYRVLIGNQYSDYSEETDAFKQFINFDLDVSQIYYSNLQTLGESVDRILGQHCTDYGCLLRGYFQLLGIQTFNRNTSSWSPASVSDLVFDLVVSLPTFLATLLSSEPSNLAVISFTAHGVNLMNAGQFPALEDVDRDEVVRYAIENDLFIPQRDKTIDVYVNGQKVDTLHHNRVLVDDYTSSRPDVHTIDNNQSSQAPLPRLTRLTITNDLEYNSGLQAVRKSIDYVFLIDVTQQNFFQGVADAFTEFLDDPPKFFLKNLVNISIVLTLLVIVSYIRANWRAGGRGGGINIVMPQGRQPRLDAVRNVPTQSRSFQAPESPYRPSLPRGPDLQVFTREQSNLSRVSRDIADVLGTKPLSKSDVDKLMRQGRL